jgi:hypothetical protein
MVDAEAIAGLTGKDFDDILLGFVVRITIEQIIFAIHPA